MVADEDTLIAGSPGTKQARGRERRSAILEAATQLFYEQGVPNTSIAAVAAAVGITDAGLLYHFPTKDDLVLAVLRRSDAKSLAALPDLQAGALTTLRAIGEWGGPMEQDEALTSLHVMLSAEHLTSDSALHAYFQERYEWVAEHVVDAIRKGQAAGELRTDIDPLAEANYLIATMDGARLRWFYSNRQTSIADIVRHHVDLMVERLAVRA